MVTRFNPPTRKQISDMANGDDRMVRALEQLWRAGGQDLSDIQAQVDALTIVVAGNTARIKTNEVLLWLSM